MHDNSLEKITGLKNYRIQVLDALRGLAIVLVVFDHYIASMFDEGIVRDIMLCSGFAGVLLFFYLSGFLVYRCAMTQSPGQFVSRRFFKIAPAYWVNIFLVLLILPLFEEGHSFIAKDVISNMFLVQEFTHSDLVNGVYWTLQIEVKFYFAMFMLQIFFGVKRVYYLYASLCFLNLGSYFFLGRGSVFLTFVVLFFPGIAMANAVEYDWSKKAWVELVVVTLVAFADTFLLPNAVKYGGPPCVLIFAVLMVLALRKGSVRLPLLTFFGTISYSLYMYHQPLRSILFTPWMAERIPLGWGGAIMVSFAVAVAVSSLSYWWVERPLTALGRRLEHFPRNRGYFRRERAEGSEAVTRCQMIDDIYNINVKLFRMLNI